MLKKLFKYELQATARAFGGVYLILLGVSVLLGLLLRRLDYVPGDQSDMLVVAGTVLLLVYGALLVSIFVMTVVTIISRFAGNLLGQEGYLMHTLPVSARQLLLSKLGAALFWSLASLLMAGLSLLLLFLLSTELFSLGFGDWVQLLQRLQENASVSLPLLLLFLLLGLVAGILSLVTCVYAACMIGHQVKKYQVPLSILAAIVLLNLQNLLLGLLGMGSMVMVGASRHLSLAVGEGTTVAMPAIPVPSGLSSTGVFSAYMISVALPLLVFAAIYFFVAEVLMRKHLNLE